MSYLNLSDRLKAAVNSIDAAGTHLQQRALGQNAPQQSSQPAHTPSRATSPSIQTSSTSIPSASSEKVAGTSANPTSPSSTRDPQLATSPTKAGHPYAAANALAEGALSNLRKSFNFGRQSLEHARPGPSSPRSPSSSTLAMGPTSPIQELKDIPSSPKLNSSRPSSPARFLSATAPFSLGSDPNSAIGTPRPKSPLHRTKSPLHHPPPDPDDPATYPLPPSPTIPNSPLPVPESVFADPLGASPLLPPVEEIAVPALEVEGPTPKNEKRPDAAESGVEVNATADIGNHKAEEAGTESLAGTGRKSVDDARRSGESSRAAAAATTEDASTQLAKAERRYEDLSNRFTTLLTQKHNADKVLRDLTPLEGGIGDSEALEGWVRMMNGKVDMITEEMRRLQSKIALQESRIQEIRDTHRLEGSSQSELISKLRQQLSTAETSLAQKTTDTGDVAQLKADLVKAQTSAKEEEEKRSKAISLLKTVRMKLVKAEKDKEEIEKDRAEERAERSNAKDEVERVKAEKEREVNSLRKGFEREIQGVKDRAEKDLAAKKAAWELDMITTKASHAKELSGKTTKVAGLEAIVKELSQTNQAQFEDLQSKTAEVESGRNELETLRSKTKELEFQLREALERCAILEDSSARPSRSHAQNHSLAPSRGPSPSPSRGGSSPVEVQRLLAEAEAKAESRISDLRNKIRSLETERNDAEEEWAAKLGERVRELEKLRRIIMEKESDYAESQRMKRDHDKSMEEAEEAKRGVEREMKALRAEVEAAKLDTATASDAERAAKEELVAAQLSLSNVQAQLDDARSHATNLRNNNKTLREELRKVQSSVQLLEKSRNPGVGYWSNTNATRSGIISPEPERARNSMESSRTQMSVAGAPVGSGPSTPATTVAAEKNKGEEEVNLEYLRNVILQFLENKEMRPNLVRVLSVILRFTPQELRRLNAKLSA